MPQVLVIGIGNTLRSDDGFAWHVVDELNRQEIEGLRALKIHQLMPELAETISEANLAIFVDAGEQGVPGTLTCNPVTASSSDFRFSHDVTPATLVQMAKALYGKEPKASLICVTGKSFEHGDSLSPEIAAVIPQAVEKIRGLL